MMPALSALDTMLADIRVAARTPLDDRPAAVAEAIRPYLDDPRLLAEKDCPCCPDRYIRHLLGEGDGYAVVALVWRPGQMSPVHAHRTWCALGVHRGVLSEHFFQAGETPCPTAVHLRGRGATSHGPASPELIHRIANCSAEVAVSIHVYGVPFADFAEGVNEVLA
ncbi:cysteine dioxygenase family protein [Roseococcus pinisoli]|uniref:Cysteine dioxygenase family protein n=1 Tax=Roseococcus pinisoli TaxID=2835040 RepID=A0ABS5QG49_9PROT|nr:cysteine dioxygenase family protein [Roseococcus pinisoli]MBS7812669.1 cysteine dioxygenase family protein [Roseococcus pinisoli]